MVIVRQGVDLWPGVLAPYGSVPARLALGALVAVAVVGALVAYLAPRAGVVRHDLTQWLAILGAGVLAIGVGYAMFLPADDYYSPETLGIGDRTNAFAALGWALVVVALVRLVATLAFRDLPRSALLVAAAVAVTLGAVGVG